MTRFQKLFLGILPRKWAQSAEAESRAWRYQCPSGFERSCWDAGGIRWKAAGNPRYLRTCPGCGETTWHTVYKSNVADFHRVGNRTN